MPVESVPAASKNLRASMWPAIVRQGLSRLFPGRPWMWEKPERFVAARLGLALLDRFWPQMLERDWTLPYASRGKIICSLHDIKDRVILMHGFSEYEVAHLIARLVGENWVCVDVGANSGEYTLLFALYAPRGHVYAFEPAYPVYPRLQANVKLNAVPHVTTEQAAVGAEDGTCTFYVDRSRENTGLSSLSRETWRGQGRLEEVRVRCLKLDTYFARAERVDLIKIDVEGHELDVLVGASHTLRTMSPVVVFEFGSIGNLPHPGPVDFLRRSGYGLYCINYSLDGGPSLVPCPTLEEGLLRRFYDPRGPLNLVAVPDSRRASFSDLIVVPPS